MTDLNSNWEVAKKTLQNLPDNSVPMLVGIGAGAGFGIGLVVNGQLNRGDNSCVETFCLHHKTKPGIIVEDGVAVRAIKRVYAEESGYTGNAMAIAAQLIDGIIVVG